ncbi:MAG TPA: amidohydrolase family protein [Gemmataceae bacterium]|nr:amidohydrolase family protein [Gemmataceae bacterium]
MSGIQVSRRDSLRTLGGAFLAGAFGAGGWPQRTVADEHSSEEAIIDTHVHVVNTRLPGLRGQTVPLAPFGKDDTEGMKRLVKMIEEETKRARVVHALCMPRFEVSDRDPLGIEATLAVAERVRGPKLHPIGLAHPERFDQDHLDRVEAVLREGKVKALKVYLGYLHYEPYSPGYRRYYKLAAKYKIPVIFHCGDTYSRTAKVKYAHPLKIDEVAVDFPETKFVLAHFGNPWIMDAAQVVYKNKNVWADLSAILIGDVRAFTSMREEGVLSRAVKRIKEGIEYSESPEKLLFGSDWPLSPMVVYRDFVRQLFPEKQHAAVFGGNARKLFGL